MCVYLHICVCAWMNTTTYIWAIKQPHTYIYIYIYIYAWMNTTTYIWAIKQPHTYIYIDTHIVSESYQEGNVQLSVITVEIYLSGEMCHNK